MQLNLIHEPAPSPYAHLMRPPIVVQGRPMVRRRGLVIKLRTSHGLEGLGDVAPWPGFAEASMAPEIAAAKDAAQKPQAVLQELHRAWQAVLRDLPQAPITLPDAWDGTTAQVAQVMDHLMALTAAAPAEMQGAVQCAWLDLLGQVWRQPMAHLLGPKAAADVPVHALVDSAWAAGNACQAGYTALKVKVGRRSISDELGTLCGIRSAVGTKVALRLDANGAWPQHIAVQALRMFASVSPAWVEQPIAPGDVAGMRALKALAIAPIAVDESITSAASLREVLEHNAADGVVIKPAFVGGPLSAVQLGRMAQEAGIQVCITHALESQVGRAAALQVALALRVQEACGLGGALEGDSHGAAPVLAGRIQAPRGFGLGLQHRPLA